MEDRPSVHLDHGFGWRTHSEWTLFGLAGDIGAGLTAKASTEAVEHEYRLAVVRSLDYVPRL
jgi:hypothetical protein